MIQQILPGRPGMGFLGRDPDGVFEPKNEVAAVQRADCRIPTHYGIVVQRENVSLGGSNGRHFRIPFRNDPLSFMYAFFGEKGRVLLEK